MGVQVAWTANDVPNNPSNQVANYMWTLVEQ
jgi:hypothetical protein